MVYIGSYGLVAPMYIHRGFGCFWGHATSEYPQNRCLWLHTNMNVTSEIFRNWYTGIADPLT